MFLYEIIRKKEKVVTEMSLQNSNVNFYSIEHEGKSFLICVSRVATLKLIFVEEISTAKRVVVNKAFEDEKDLFMELNTICSNW